MTHGSTLPYITLNLFDPPHALKFLIDTGSSYSFIDPAIIPQESTSTLDREIKITTVMDSYTLKMATTLPMPKEFGEQGEINLLLFKFHPYFNGLVGIDVPTKVKAKIDIKNLKLDTQSASIGIIINAETPHRTPQQVSN